MMSTRLYARRGNTLPKPKPQPADTIWHRLFAWAMLIGSFAVLAYMVVMWLAVVQ